ncbi:MAG: pyruvate:ferredoxin (flavodoxin) oxidoreductase [Planctomycetota bacterium]
MKSRFPYQDAPVITVDGNDAASYVAYLNSEVVALYPITPSSPMGESADARAAVKETNLFGNVPRVVELQSEAGAAGTIHGALTAGAQAATFTASQGLLLMIPNMYKIAGELTPTVFQVSARALSAQGLSIFGDHSDVMAVRGTGFGLSVSANPQEVMDIAAITLRASLKSRIPFIHFFDGFRTSHEIRKIRELPREFFRDYLDPEDIRACRLRALDPHRADLRGTAQNPDIYFQGRETVNPYYDAAPAAFEEACRRFRELTGRSYSSYEYFGAADAQDVIVLMGSSADTAEKTVEILNAKNGARVGLLKVRLYRPMDGGALVKALPPTVRRIAVLDRTKEPGAPAEPLCLDVQAALAHAVSGMEGYPRIPSLPLVIGGRYGLGSKEFTPGMVAAAFRHLAGMSKSGARVWTGFTLGINDDITHRSLDCTEIDAENADAFKGKFFGLGADGTVGANKNSIKIIGENTDLYAQGYFVYDSKKAGAITISHLRFSKEPIRQTYLIQRPNFVAVHNPSFLSRYDVLEGIEEGATLLLNTTAKPGEVFSGLVEETQRTIIEKKLKVFGINGTAISEEVGLRGRINIAMQTAFFEIAKVLPREKFVPAIRDAIEKTYGSKGGEIVAQNIRAMELALERIFPVKVPSAPVPSDVKPFRVEYDRSSPDARFIENVVLPVMQNRGDTVPVSAVPVNGAIPLNTARLEHRNIAIRLPEWNPSLCIQCNMCSFMCPHSTIRPKLIAESDLEKLELPADEFATLPARGYKGSEPMHFRIQVAPDDCTGCGACAEVCPGKEKDPATKKPTGKKAITMRPKEVIQEKLRRSWSAFLALPETDESLLNPSRFKDVQFRPVFFEFPGACAGCGETPYVRLVTQLFGGRLYIANATGCSSIYGGTMPVVPYCKNGEGEGVSWQSSLFEDNAEFGLGIRLAADKLRESAWAALSQAIDALEKEKASGEILTAARAAQAAAGKNGKALRDAVIALDRALAGVGGKKLPDALRGHIESLASLSSHLLEKIVWILGGDGWAYDIGFGGLDHVLAGLDNVNILVLDTGVYSNTGGQCSKATPMGAIAKFAATGKRTPKKELGLIAMTYKTAYVAQIAYGANPAQTLKAVQEAAAYPGPSLVIAYAPCIEHGYPLNLGPEHMKLAVDCGLWPLFRFDPRRMDQGLNPLELDSGAPTAEVGELIRQERRFKSLEIEQPEIARTLFEEARRAVRRNYLYFQKLAGLPYDEFRIEA